MTTVDQPTRSPPKAAIPRLGEELPIFCEKCGYSLHGLPQSRCDHCEILQFICPECGHRQPINTLRPTFQRLLGRVRAVLLVGVVFFKLNYFGWLAFAWFAMGVEWTYVYRNYGGNTYQLTLRDLSLEMGICFMMLAIPYALVGRMLLLRWRRGALVGLALAVQVWALVTLGAWFRATIGFARVPTVVESLWNSPDFFYLAVLTIATIVLSAAAAWPVWTLLVRAFLPPKTAHTLLEWQRSQSDQSTSQFARQ
jgi:hypothetical protein